MADDQDTPIGYGFPAIYVNRYTLWATAPMIRFVMGDSVSGTEQDVKMAFIMSREDAKTLAETIQKLLSETTQPQLPNG